MKHLGRIFLALGLLAHVHAGDICFYVATQTHNGGKGIYLGHLDTRTGTLGPLTPAADVEEPGFLALSPDHHFLYASQSLKTSAVTGFRIGPNHELMALNTQLCRGRGACHLTVDATGKNVLIANYSSGDLVCLARHADGSLGGQTSFFQATGSGPYKSRQGGPHVHSVYLDPVNRHLYSCDLGTDTIWMFLFQAETGTLVAMDPPQAKVPPGSGCRHLVNDPTGHFVYVNNEMAMTVSVFSRDPISGRLKLQQTVSMLPPGVKPEPGTSAEIFCDPSGRYLYISNRGIDTISRFRIGTEGRLDDLKTVPAGVEMPRSFALDSTGYWLLVAGQKSNTLALFKIDPTNGELKSTDQTLTVPEPMCVLFAD